MSNVDEFDTALDSPSVQIKEDCGVFNNVLFFIDPLINDIDALMNAVRNNGGQVLMEVPRNNSREWEVAYFVSKRYDENYRIFVHPSYILDCIDAGTLLNVRDYLGKPEPSGYVRFDSNAISDEYNISSQLSDLPSSDVTRTAVKIATRHDESINQDNNHNQTGLVDGNDRAIKISAKDETRNQQKDTQRQEVEQVQQMVQNSDDQQQQLTHAQGNDADELILHDPVGSSHNKSSFTKEEDEFILDVVRKNPTKRTTHTLYDEISHYVPNHTGNSIRHRFRVYLSKKLEFVYQVDEEDKLVRDSDGNLIKTDILPSGLKRKFTSEEDYNLALAVKKQFYRDAFQRDPDTGESLITEDDEPNVVAKRQLVMNTEIDPSDIPPFDKYMVNDRRGPLSREFFKNFATEVPTHSENAWRDRFRKFILPYGIDSYISYYEKCIEEGIEPESIKNMTNRPKREGPSPGNYNTTLKKSKRMAEGSSQQATDASLNDFFLESDAFDLIDGIRRDLHAAEAQQEEQARSLYAEDVAERIRHQVALEHEEYDNYDMDSIKFPPKLAENDDYFDHTFFNFRSTKEFIQKLEEIITREYDESQADVLVHDLDVECGIRKKYATSVLTALTGDISLFPRYFLTSFKYGIHPPQNVPGIWTKEDDLVLRSKNPEGMKMLEKKHGFARMQMRIRFQENNLV